MALSCNKKIICIIKRRNVMVIVVVAIAFIHFEQKTNLDLIKTVGENKDFCGVVMPSKDTKILEFNQYGKSDKTPCIIYADLESFIKRIDLCKSTFVLYKTKVGEHISCRYSQYGYLMV